MKQLNHILESIVFVSGRAVEIKDIADKIGVSAKDILETAREMQKTYSEENGIQLLIFNNKLQFSSNPAYAEQVEAVLNPIKERELSRAMLEVCAIIAYKQPITRLEIEELRGVNSDYAINLLSKHNVIEVVGRKDAIGKPLLFGTTDEFLKRFQLQSLNDLPDYDELLSRIQVLHTPSSTDLFHKDEYDPEQDEELNRVNHSLEEAAATEEKTVAGSEEPPQTAPPDLIQMPEVESVLPVAESPVLPEEVQVEPVKELLPTEEATQTLIQDNPDLQTAEKPDEEEIPEFLRGESFEIATADEEEIVGEEGDEIPDFLRGETTYMIAADDLEEETEEIPEFLKGEKYIEIK